MNKATTDLIKHFESLHDGDLKKVGLQPKLDPIGIWTEGWGRAIIDPATKQFLRGAHNFIKANKLQTIFSKEDADKALEQDLKRYESFAYLAITNVTTWISLNDNQKGALTSFIYNCGQGKPPYKIWKNVDLFVRGKMTKEQLTEYWKTSVIKGGGKVLPGLVRRRAAEAKLFFS